MSVIGTVTSISRYPVKSLQGEQVGAGRLDVDGLADDRRWGIVNVATGHVLTAKRVGRLLDARARLSPSGPTIELPDGTVLDGPGGATDRALTAWVGREVALRPAGGTPLTFEMSFNVETPDVDTFQWSTATGSLADLAPVHLLTTASLAAMADAEPASDWSVHRFRPTILIDTGDVAGFVEESWVARSIAIGGAVLTVTMPTIRCSLPTKRQGPHRLARDLDVFRALARENQQNLGAYAGVDAPGVVEVGDTVELLPER